MSFPTASAVGYLVPSLRDFEQNHHKAKAEGNSSRHAKNLRISRTENTENLEKRFTDRAISNSPAFSVSLCSENTAKPLRINGEMTQYFHAHRVSRRIMTDCVEFRDREQSVELSKTP